MARSWLPPGFHRLRDLRDLARDGMEVATPEDNPRVRTLIQLDGDMVNVIDGTWLATRPDDLGAIVGAHRANVDRRLLRLRRPFVALSWFSHTLAATPSAVTILMAWREGTGWWIVASALSPAVGWCIHRIVPATLRRIVLRRL